MTSNDQKRIAELVSMDANCKTIREIGEEWLDICNVLFSGEAGYCYDKYGNIVFIPSRLKADVTTGDLSSLLRIAGDLNKFEETYGIPNENQYIDSIISHLRKRAEKGDIQAKVVLYFRVRNKVLADDDSATTQFKV